MAQILPAARSVRAIKRRQRLHGCWSPVRFTLDLTNCEITSFKVIEKIPPSMQAVVEWRHKPKTAVPIMIINPKESSDGK